MGSGKLPDANEVKKVDFKYDINEGKEYWRFKALKAGIETLMFSNPLREEKNGGFTIIEVIIIDNSVPVELKDFYEISVNDTLDITLKAEVNHSWRLVNKKELNHLEIALPTTSIDNYLDTTKKTWHLTGKQEGTKILKFECKHLPKLFQRWKKGKTVDKKSIVVQVGTSENTNSNDIDPDDNQNIDIVDNNNKEEVIEQKDVLEKIEANSKNNCQVNIGNTFTIELEANYSTYYRWFLVDETLQTKVKKIKDYYIPNDNPEGMTGVGGVEHWDFEGIALGTETIIFEHKSRSGTGKIAEIKEIKVIVNNESEPNVQDSKKVVKNDNENNGPLVGKHYSPDDPVPFNAKQCFGLDIIGYGYDIFGDYARNSSLKDYNLFRWGEDYPKNVNDSCYKVPKGINYAFINSHDVKEYESFSIRDVYKSFSSQAGLEIDAKVFSGSVDAYYETSSSSTEEEYFFTYMDSNRRWKISIDERDGLKKMLDDRVKRDINDEEINPDDLFKTYGTHFITSAYLGTRADFTSRTKITDNTNTKDIGVAVKAKYNAVSGSAKIDTAEEETLKKAETKTMLHVVGGYSEYTNDIQDNDQYNKWADGIEEYPVLINFVDKNSLRPIWKLAETTDREKQIEDYFYNVLLKKYPLPDKVKIEVLGNKVYEKEETGEQGEWAKWTNVKYIELNGYPYIFRNGRETHGNEYVHFAKISKYDESLSVDAGYNNKDISTGTIWRVWSPGWNLIDWYEYNYKTYHMVLKENEGTMAINEYTNSDKNVEIHRENWSKGWSALQTFKINGKSYYFVYKNKGQVSIKELNTKPVHKELYIGRPLDKDIKHFKHFKIGEKHFLSALKNGRPYIYEIKFSSQKFDLKRINNNIKQDNEISNSHVINNSGDPILFLYSKDEGEGKYYMFRINKDGTIGKKINESTNFGVKSIDNFDSFEKWGNIYLLSYKKNFLRINELDIPNEDGEVQ